MNLLTLMVLAPFIFGGLAYFFFKEAYQTDKLDEQASKQVQRGTVGCFAAGVVFALMSLGAIGTLTELAHVLIKQEHIATQVIRVLDEHGWEEACKHIDCKALSDRVGVRQ